MVNGRERSWREDLTVLSLLKDLQVNPETTVVELNRKQIVLRSEYAKIKIHDGDRVEIIGFSARNVRK